MIDRILFNGNIHTFFPAQPQVSALALIGETIVAAGTDDEIKPLATAYTQLDNLNGRFVMPGLVDAHIHWEATAKAGHAVNLFNARNKAEALERIATYAKTYPTDEWIFGHGWAQDDWEEREFPTALDLDSVTGSRPAYLITKSGHAAWVNSAALKQAGIDGHTPDPAGGKIKRDHSGLPDGILLEDSAMTLVSRHIPSLTEERLAEWMLEAQTEAWKTGLVGLHDFDDPSCMVALQLLRERGQLGLRVVKQINHEWIHHAHELGIRSGFGDDWIRFGALKIFADGALGPRTAAMIAPYEGEPDNYGVVVTDKETIYELVSTASRLGMASTIHAIGDKAVHDVLDVFEAVRGEEQQNQIPPAHRRHRIEHVQLIHPDDRHRLGQLNIIASMQPIHATSDWRMADTYWGSRVRYSYHWRAQLDAGAVLVFGSDSPIDPFDTMQGIFAAVTRRNAGYPEGWYPEAKISMAEALHAYTTGPAFAAGMENRSGRLSRGFLADCIVLDKNLLEISPDEILSVQVLGTMVGGEWKHRIFD